MQCDTAKFASKSSDIKHLIDDIRAYFEEEKLSRLLCNQSDAYLTEEDYERAKELAEMEKPAIFIAGIDFPRRFSLLRDTHLAKKNKP